MRKQDLGILMLSAFATFFSLQQEGDFSFREAWFHLSEEYPIKYEADRLPTPIVADLNGDGKKEILVATHDAKIQIHLQEGGLHADVNGDGILDHVQVVGGNGAEQTVVAGSMVVLRPCFAVAMSGVPMRIIEVATPILITRSDGLRHCKGSHGDVIFLTNHGEVTLYSPGLHGHDAVRRWQLLTGANWSNLSSPSGMTEAGTVVSHPEGLLVAST